MRFLAALLFCSCLAFPPAAAQAAENLLPGTEKTAEELRKSAMQGDADAAYALAQALFMSQYTKKNIKEIIRWLSVAAEAGLPAAQFDLAVIYSFDFEAEFNDPAKAVLWFGNVTANPRSTEKEKRNARFYLAGMYERRDTPVTDPIKAEELYRKMAETGDVMAMFRLGLLYGQNPAFAGREKDSYRWLHKAAENGFSRAYFSLGALAVWGKGTAKNNAAAYMWFTLAKKTAIPTPEKNDSLDRELEQLAAKLSPEQKKKAGQDADAWLAKVNAAKKQLVAPPASHKDAMP